jgi:SH3-like domain-containing protein
MKRRFFLFACVFAVCGVSSAEDLEEIRISHFSGEPVPRFETLRYAAANGRSGPSRDHKIVWRYERKGLPLLIIKESQNWRRVRDPDGDEVWVHARMLTDAKTVMLQHVTPLRKKADPSSPTLAQIDRGVIAEIEKCDDTSCRIDVQNHKGWVDKTALWGLNISEAGL